MQLNIEVELDDEFLDGWLVTATEGGINYWAHVLSRHENAGVLCERPKIVIVTFENLFDSAEIEYEDPDKDGPMLKATLDRALMERGIGMVLAPGFQVNPDIRNDIYRAVSDGEATMDADAVDVIVQAGLFGKIVFG